MVLSLTKVFRQQDQQFSRLLGELRLGVVTEEAQEVFGKQLAVPLRDREGYDPAIAPTRLFSRNDKASAVNMTRLAELDEKTQHVFAAADMIELLHGGDKKYYEKHFFFKDGRVDKQLSLRTGAQVMLMVNLDIRAGEFAPQSLCNGSRGAVIGFERVGEDATEYPRVRFTNGVERVITPHRFEHEETNVVRLTRSQVPLRLAWAMSIHKSQGMSLDYAIVCLDGTFAAGQAYVALSRAREMRGLQVEGFCAERIITDPLVVRFYQQNCDIAGLPLW